MDNTPRLRHLPISAFAVVMGLCGVAIAWNTARGTLHAPGLVADGLLALSGAVFMVLTLLYLIKIIRHLPEVLKELRNPVALNFFPTFSISLILLGIGTLHTLPTLSWVLWASGTVAQLLFTLYVMQVWIHHEHFEIHHMNPAWFIPVVGNILVPIAGVQFGHTEISWFFFSTGLLFWLVLLSIVFNRVIFHQALPDKLLPTLFILIAPPAVGFVSYLGLSGELDSLARVLYYAALFLTLLLLTQTARFTRLPFTLSWWAYSFPLAAVTVATMLMHERLELKAFATLSYTLLGLVTVLIGYLSLRTLVAIGRRQICIEGG